MEEIRTKFDVGDWVRFSGMAKHKIFITSMEIEVCDEGIKVWYSGRLHGKDGAVIGFVEDVSEDQLVAMEDEPEDIKDRVPFASIRIKDYPPMPTVKAPRMDNDDACRELIRAAVIGSIKDKIIACKTHRAGNITPFTEGVISGCHQAIECVNKILSTDDEPKEPETDT